MGGSPGRAERITNLDTLRGIATLGVLVMGVAGEVFIDQKQWRSLFCSVLAIGVIHSEFWVGDIPRGRHCRAS